MTSSRFSGETGFVKSANPKLDKTTAVRVPTSRRQFEVVVIFTNPHSTLEALKTAAILAAGLGVRIRLLCPRLTAGHSNQPASQTPFFKHRFRAVAGEHKAEVFIDVRSCSDRAEMVESVLTPESIVTIGRGRFWPGWERRLAHRLRLAGHHVIFA